MNIHATTLKLILIITSNKHISSFVSKVMQIQLSLKVVHISDPLLT